MFSYDPYTELPSAEAFTLMSVDVRDGDDLPGFVYGDRDGAQALSPQLSWTGFPPETRSFAVTCLDPDAPTGSGFWHWAVFNLPTTVTSLPRGAGSSDSSALNAPAVTLPNDAGFPAFAGAAPPSGTGPHRYMFVVHAVDVESLGLAEEATPALLGFNLHFHTLARARLSPIGRPQ